MTNAEYTAKADFLILLATVLADAASQAEDCLSTIGHAHSVGPVVDPTAYRNGMRNLREQEELFRPLLACARQLGPIIERHRAAAKVPR